MAGYYYIDTKKCYRPCDVCTTLAPENFKLEENEIVVIQPSTDEEVEACVLAEAECPEAAIFYES